MDTPPTRSYPTSRVESNSNNLADKYCSPKSDCPMAPKKSKKPVSYDDDEEYDRYAHVVSHK